jgi:hypothetical protein
MIWVDCPHILRVIHPDHEKPIWSGATGIPRGIPVTRAPQG